MLQQWKLPSYISLLVSATTTSHFTTPPPTKDASRSYLEAARGSPPLTTMAAYPGDPRARPECETVFVSATGDIRRRRDALLGKAVVCWLRGNSHDTEPFHVGDALHSKLGMGFGNFQVVKHYSEQFLIIFSELQKATQAEGHPSSAPGGWW